MGVVPTTTPGYSPQRLTAVNTDALTQAGTASGTSPLFVPPPSTGRRRSGYGTYFAHRRRISAKVLSDAGTSAEAPVESGFPDHPVQNRTRDWKSSSPPATHNVGGGLREPEWEPLGLCVNGQIPTGLPTAQCISHRSYFLTRAGLNPSRFLASWSSACASHLVRVLKGTRSSSAISACVIPADFRSCRKIISTRCMLESLRLEGPSLLFPPGHRADRTLMRDSEAQAEPTGESPTGYR